jgi:hypothetical protein
MLSNEERRGRRLSLRVSTRERSRIEAQADHAGLCLSDYLRRIVLGAKPLRARRRPPLEVQLAAQLLAQLGVITSDLRAIAAACSPLMPFVERELARALRDLAGYRTRLLRLLGRRAGAP